MFKNGRERDAKKINASSLEDTQRPLVGVFKAGSSEIDIFFPIFKVSLRG